MRACENLLFFSFFFKGRIVTGQKQPFWAVWCTTRLLNSGGDQLCKLLHGAVLPQVLCWRIKITTIIAIICDWRVQVKSRFCCVRFQLRKHSHKIALTLPLNNYLLAVRCQVFRRSTSTWQLRVRLQSKRKVKLYERVLLIVVYRCTYSYCPASCSKDSERPCIYHGMVNIFCFFFPHLAIVFIYR